MVPVISRSPRKEDRFGVTWIRRIVCLALGFVGALHAQQSERLVSARQASQMTDAVMISDVSVEGKSVECGLFIKPPRVIQPVAPFLADDDWLQHTAISLINRTGKTIAHGGIIIHFLDTGDCQAVPCAGSQLAFGRRPAVDAYDERTGQPLAPGPRENAPLGWKPEQTIVIHLSDYIAEIRDDLANFMPVTAITKVSIYRGPFYFDDGMKWSIGGYFAPDPEHPGKFTALAKDYFPGKRGRNWPPGYSQ